MRLFHERQVESHNRDVRQAWLVAYFTRSKKPSIEKFLIGERPAQTMDEQLQVLKVLSKRYGGAVYAHG